MGIENGKGSGGRKKCEEEGKEQNWEQKDCAELKNEWNGQLSLFLLRANL